MYVRCSWPSWLSMVARTDIAWQRPDTRRVNIHAPGFEYSEGYDGRTLEYNFQTLRLVVDTGAAADASRRGASLTISHRQWLRRL